MFPTHGKLQLHLALLQHPTMSIRVPLQLTLPPQLQVPVLLLGLAQLSSIHSRAGGARKNNSVTKPRSLSNSSRTAMPSTSKLMKRSPSGTTSTTLVVQALKLHLLALPSSLLLPPQLSLPPFSSDD